MDETETPTPVNRSVQEPFAAGNAYRLPGVDVMGNTPQWKLPNTIVFTTTKEAGEWITLQLNAATADQAGVWIDLNNNGTQDYGEKVTNFSGYAFYTINSQTVTVHGKVTLFASSTHGFTSLNVRNSTALESLICVRNQLTSLDVSANTALRSLVCYDNQLPALDLRNNTALEGLNCGTNPFTSLDVSRNTALKKLNCSNNQLTSLDVSKNTELLSLYCWVNQIEARNMVALVNSLPNRSGMSPEGDFRMIESHNPKEGNDMWDITQRSATDKRWPPRSPGGAIVHF